MRKYSIFYRDGGKYYQIYQQNEKFWLGGSRVQWLLFHTKAEAERVAKVVRKQKSPLFERGTIEVHLAKLQVWD